jgi:hypothetical protein
LLFASVQRCLLSSEGDAAGATATRLAGVDAKGAAAAAGTGAKEEEGPAPIERLKWALGSTPEMVKRAGVCNVYAPTEGFSRT